MPDTVLSPSRGLIHSILQRRGAVGEKEDGQTLHID